MKFNNKETFCVVNIVNKTNFNDVCKYLDDNAFMSEWASNKIRDVIDHIISHTFIDKIVISNKEKVLILNFFVGDVHCNELILKPKKWKLKTFTKINNKPVTKWCSEKYVKKVETLFSTIKKETFFDIVIKIIDDCKLLGFKKSFWQSWKTETR